MASVDEITKLIENLYTVDRLMTAIQKKPNTYAQTKLHANEAHTLERIACKEGISQSELSEQMHRTKGATSVMVDKLVKKGLVNRQREEGNQRRYLLTLTEKGRSVNEAHSVYDAQHAEGVAKNLSVSEEELLVTNQTLQRVIEFYLENYLKE